MATMLFILGAANAQRLDVIQKGSHVHVYDKDGRELSNMYIGDNKICGVGRFFFVVKKGSYAHIYDSECREICDRYIGEKKIVVDETGFDVQEHPNRIVTYDAFCRTLWWRDPASIR